MKRLILSLGILTMMVVACVEFEPVSPIPEISFISYELFDGTDSLGNPIIIGRIEFSFIDGDADFGMELQWMDTTGWDERNYNVFFKPYEKIDSVYFRIPDDTVGKEYPNYNPPPYYKVWRETPLDRVGQNKTVRGIIRINMEFQIIPEYDTVRYDFYITDRANNKSNVASTSDIGFKGISLPEALNNSQNHIKP